MYSCVIPAAPLSGKDTANSISGRRISMDRGFRCPCDRDLINHTDTMASLFSNAGYAVLHSNSATCRVIITGNDD